ncbi:MAG: tRNA (adenosine(37)-N6)-threonylcarbamoyltransferase complex dimerization subunit type 1 TsaB [Bacillota bacterium]|nr:tRNA (adenosine(37)-N6)-threonylcarbamoyltransferase complex dimerization subunit type 1 TsaB [Bacillota bacterium]
MRVLSIDTSTEAASVAVIEENKLLCEININHKLQHSVILMEEIDKTLSYLKMSLEDMDGFVLSKGPGSFTGLRIGAAVIKGLSQGSGKPFIAVSSLDGLANNLNFSDGIIISMIDALRDKVYARLYSTKSGMKYESEIMLIEIDELIKISGAFPKVTFIGDGSTKYKERLKTLQSARFAAPSLNLCRASSLGELGLKLLSEGKSDDIFTFTPLYINKSYAEK